MFTITSTYPRADAQTTQMAVSAAKALTAGSLAAIEIANPPVVIETAEGVKVMAWLPVGKGRL